MAGGEAQLPPFADVSTDAAQSFVWLDAAEETRALARPTAIGRLAAAWHAEDSYALRLRLLDGQTHRVAIYFLDWDSNNARSQEIQVLDSESSNVLDAQTVSSFSEGKYFVWALQGDVTIKISAAGEGNAVSSGVFLDPYPASLEEWKAQWFALEDRLKPEIGGDEADPDHDGLSNLFEYATGSPPTVANEVPAIGFFTEGNSLVFSFFRLKAATDVIVIPEVSTDLIDWHTGAGFVDEFETSEQDAIETVKARFGPMVAEEKHVFVRLRVERN